MKFSSNNLTLSYNATHNPEPSSESDGRQERAGPHPEVGRKEFVRRMREWGKLGGRPKGTKGKDRKRGQQ
jgi:hypothetical protein